MNPSDSRYGPPRFRFLIRVSQWPPHHRNGSPVLHGISSTTCHPCYPESRWTPLPLFQRPSSGLPLQDTGSASPFSVTRLRLGSLALRPAALPCETYDLRLLGRRFPVLERRTDNSFHGTLTRWKYRRSRRTPRPLIPTVETLSTTRDRQVSVVLRKLNSVPCLTTPPNGLGQNSQ